MIKKKEEWRFDDDDDIRLYFGWIVFAYYFGCLCLCFVLCLCLCAPIKNIKIFNIINARIVAVALPTVVLLITRSIVLPFAC
jgi:hypothetical protein